MRKLPQQRITIVAILAALTITVLQVAAEPATPSTQSVTAYAVQEHGGALAIQIRNSSPISGWMISDAKSPGTERRTAITGGRVVLGEAGGKSHLLKMDLTTADSNIALRNAGSESFAMGALRFSASLGHGSVASESESFAGRPVFAWRPDTIVVEKVSAEVVTISGELTLSGVMRVELGADAASSETPFGTFRMSLPIKTAAPAPDATPVLPVSVGGPTAASVIGPDIVVSSLGGNFSEWGLVGDISSYSFDTTSCNRGDQNAIWIDCTNGGPQCNQHPVIAQNLYRMRTVNGATQFDQIGQAWLKHGFFALDASLCGACQNANTGDFLGVNCSDTYSASLNAFQSGMGPRSEVNAYTGVYPYPYGLHWRQTGNAVFKRLQVHLADLNPAQNDSAIYIAEGQYVVTDESPTQRFNNASWKQATVTTLDVSGWNLEFTGMTREQETALDAWAFFDTGVGITDVFVPNEGKFRVAAKVTDLGTGTWHYDYAVYNMNSDISARSFSVPVPTGVGITNIGFHDVDYHSDEPWSGVDWTAVVQNNSLTWSTDDFATDSAANALRWGTTYSFRFDADGPPVSGTTTLGMFKPGPVTSLPAVASVPGAPPAGCNCNSDLGCDDGSICTVDSCAACVCVASPNTYGDTNHNGIINIFDVFCVLDVIAGDLSQCQVVDVDINPCTPDGAVNVFDIFAVLNAFSGINPCCSLP